MVYYRTWDARLKPLRRLSTETFAHFGHVARAGEGLVKEIRGGAVRLSRSEALFRHTPEAVDFTIDFYEVRGESETLTVRMAENHPNSSQVFIPMQVARYLVVVWPDRPGAGVEPEAFIGTADDVVVYNPGVWHQGIVALDSDAVFASAMWRTRGGVDVEFAPIEPAFDITVPPAQ
jgi:ureidoglycolate lyase